MKERAANTGRTTEWVVFSYFRYDKEQEQKEIQQSNKTTLIIHTIIENLMYNLDYFFYNFKKSLTNSICIQALLSPN